MNYRSQPRYENKFILTPEFYFQNRSFENIPSQDKNLQEVFWLNILIKEVKQMNILQWLQNTVQSILQGVSRIFQPTDDDYPQSGVQPFEGEPYNDREQS